MSLRHRPTPNPSRTIRYLRAAGLLSAVVLAAAVPAILLNDNDSNAQATQNSAAILDAPAARPPQPKPSASASASARSAKPTTPATTQPAAPKPPAAKELAFEFQLQSNYYYCGPAATRMALTARGVRLNQYQIGGRLGTTVNGTNSSYDVTRVLNSTLGTNSYQTRSIPGQKPTPAEMDRLQADVVRTISSGYVVVANIIGSATDAAGVWHNFPGGHYVAIVAYRDEGRTVKIADSSGEFGPSTYWISTINTANWIASRGYSA